MAVESPISGWIGEDGGVESGAKQSSIRDGGYG